jgi:hypothetical protein
MNQRDEFREGELERGRESNRERGGRDAESSPVTNEWEAARGYGNREHDQAPFRQDFRTRYREMPSRGGGGFPRDQYGREHSRDQLFDQREPFRRQDDLRYYGTGSPGPWGNPGPGFTGGAHGYDNSSRYPEHSLQGEYSDESTMSYESQNRREYRAATPPPRYPRGPKGYQRSDERLKEDISERLMEAYHIDSSEVTVEVRGAKVSLEGTVPSRHMKHAIEDMVDRCPGVLDIDNRIRVAGLNYQGSGPTTMSQSQSGSTALTSSPPKSKQ